MLKQITLLRDRVEDWNKYPFSVAAIQRFECLTLHSRVCFFTGENGSGKSTLLESIAAHYGFGREGGNRNFLAETSEGNHSVDPLVRALRLAFNKRTGAGFFLRAESLFNIANHIDNLGVNESYGGQSLHSRSHGEAFFTLFESKFRRNGHFLMDEPEAALSPQRQLALLVLIHDVLQQHKEAQFIISTHSPVLLGYPWAQIMSFDEGEIHQIEYEQTAPMQIMKRFLNDREGLLRELFREEPHLFD